MKAQRSIVLVPEALCLLPLTITHIAKDASTHITLMKAKGLCFKPRLVAFYEITPLVPFSFFPQVQKQVLLSLS